jgi:AcrR family transcriptional regulator
MAEGDASETAAPAATGADRQRRARLDPEERRRQIIEAAQQMFANHSLHGARTREIAQAAHINEATLFHHFPSKNELFEAAVIEPLVQAMREMEDCAKTINRAADAEEMERLAGASTTEWLAEMIRIFPLLLSVLASDSRVGRRFYQKRFVPLLRRSAGSLRTLIKPPLDPTLVAIGSFGALFAYAMHISFGGTTEDIGLDARQLSAMLISGFGQISAKKGRGSLPGMEAEAS